jgi:DNA-binding HxlR family transcriptional regulator
MRTLEVPAIRLLAGRWSVAVLAALAEGGRRYQDLDAALDGVSHKVLTDTLRRAERDGLIIRQVDSSSLETSTLYELTDLGRSLDSILAVIEEWTERYWPDVEEARHRWGARGT